MNHELEANNILKDDLGIKDDIEFNIDYNLEDEDIDKLFNDMCDANDNDDLLDNCQSDESNDFESLYKNMIEGSPRVMDSPRTKNDDDNDLFKCKDCGADQIYYDAGGNYCSGCGAYLGDMINNEFINCNEKNLFDRFSVPVSNHMPQSSLGTTISLSRYYDFYKLRKYHTWNQMPYKERSLYKSFQIIMSGASKENIPSSITELAKTYYKNFSNLKITRGVNRSAVIAACIYYACKENNVPRSSKEIANMFNLNICDMTKGCKIYISVMKKKEITTYINSNNPLHYIKRFCSKLNIDTHINNLAEYAALKSLHLKIVKENTPASIASGSIYFVGFIIEGKDKASKLKKNISQKCKISEVTISKCFKKMYNPLIRDQLFPASIRNTINF